MAVEPSESALPGESQREAAADDAAPIVARTGGLLGGMPGHLQTPLFRNAYALIVNTGITALLGFAYWVVAARLFSSRDVGLAAAAISAMTLLAGISLFNLEAVLVRFIPIAGLHTMRLTAAVYILCGTAAVITASIFILALDLLEPTLRFLKENAGGAWFVVATTAWMMFVLQDGIMVGLGRAVWVPIENAVFGALKLALLLFFAGTGPFGIFESWSIAAVIVVVPFTAIIFRRFVPSHMGATSPDRPALTLAALRKYATADYVGAMFDLAAISLLPLIVTHIAGPVQNAFFYQSWIIAYTLILVANNTSRALTVEAAKDEGQVHAYGRTVFTHTLKLLIPAVAAIVLLAPILLQVFGQEYADGGAASLRILALAAIPHVVVLMALVTARVQHRMREVIAIQAATAVIVLGGAILLIGPLGSEGAAIAWLAGQTIVAIVLLLTRVQWLYRPDPIPAHAEP